MAKILHFPGSEPMTERETAKFNTIRMLYPHATDAIVEDAARKLIRREKISAKSQNHDRTSDDEETRITMEILGPVLRSDIAERKSADSLGEEE